MTIAPKVKGSILVTIGYVLSPLSWWNDPFVNLPIAYAIGLLFGRVSPRLFSPAMVVGYWLTNVVGLALLGAGSVRLAGSKRARSRRREILVNLAVSIAYTAVIVALIRFGVIRLTWKGVGR